ncbi:MAG: UDP-2,3-diacylglucosamine diphosphatase [Burkholderiales bacterium]
MAQIFISDLHLCAARPGIVRLFEDFLRGPVSQASALYILGDLFEYWAGDDDLVEPFNAHIAACLAACAERGTHIYFIRGNRDFLVGDEFARVCRLTLLEDPSNVLLDDGEVLLSHGDALCTDDTEYQAFRAKVRGKLWRETFLQRSLTDRKSEIEKLRAQSEAGKRLKPTAIMDVNHDAVADLYRREHVSRLIHGHTHRPARHAHDVDGITRERWVLADWYEHGSYLLGDNTGLRAYRFPNT